MVKLDVGLSLDVARFILLTVRRYCATKAKSNPLITVDKPFTIH